jgi:hypothetical protein
MSWRRLVRLTVAAVGLATAAAIVVLMRERPAPPDRGAMAPLDPDASLQTGGGADVRFRDDKRQAWIAFDAQTVFKDGRKVWKNARVTLQDGTVLEAGTAESIGESQRADGLGAELQLRDGARLTTAAGATLAGASAVYDHETGDASIPGAVTFSRGRVSGRGTGGEYGRETGTFRVLADVVVTLDSEPPGGRIEASARTMTFTAATRSMLFEGGARISRATDVLSADRATLFLSEDDEHFRMIELRNRARVAPAAGAAGGLPAMQAQDIDLTFHDGTQALSAAVLVGQAQLTPTTSDGAQSIDAPRIDLKTATDGQTLTDLDAGPSGVVVRLPAGGGMPARVIESATLAADGTEKSGLLSALFSGAVRFIERAAATKGRGASTREGRSGLLTLALDGRLNAVRTATFRQDVTFETRTGQTTTTASADVGVYEAASGRLELTPSTIKPGRLPRATDGEVTVNADARILVDLNTNNLEAHANVTTASTGKTKGPARGFFTAGESVLGAAAAFRRDSQTGALEYTGTAKAPAWLQQGEDSRVEAVTIVLNEETGDLTATGQVRSTVTLEGGPGVKGTSGKEPAPYLITAETMQYVEKQRAATYGGAPVVLQRRGGQQQETRSRSLVVTLARDDRRLERLDAAGEMAATIESGREAVGDRLVYDAAADLYTVTGRPAILRVRNEDGTCSRSRGLFVRFRLGGGHDWPMDQNPGGSQTGPYSCTEPLR